ncbi:uncharacterized protein LOC132621185 [Lycium barbarum]|uniref:uncharacterized protein LOC132621185 n=1 Tax=Lycium barbarum TaxID=112863 RepID=UPI00293E48AB|nr:uncharacterized protein LOC132621185 [Lycium barbarum]
MLKDLFHKRLSTFYNSLIFHKQDLWCNSDVVVINSQQEKNPNSQSCKFYLWLVGEELNDTTTIFTPTAIYFFCTQKNYSKIRSLCCSATFMNKIPVSVQLKAKNDDGFVLIDSTIRNAKEIRNKKVFFDGLDDDRSYPFVVGYIEGEYPKSKLFWSCVNDLEPKKFKAVTVNYGLSKMINTAAKQTFGVELSDEELKPLEIPPKHIFTPHVIEEKMKDKRESNLWSDHDEQMFLQFLEKGNDQSALLEKEKSNLESKFERIGLGEKGRSNLDSKFEKTKFLWGEENFKPVSSKSPMSSRVNETVSLMGNLDLSLSFSSSSGKLDKLRAENIHSDSLFKFGGNLVDRKEDNSKAGNKNCDQVFKFGASSLGAKEDKSKEISKNGDQVFKFGASKLDGKDSKAMEGNKNVDQLFKFEEGKKDDAQKFKVGGKRGRNHQPQLKEEKLLTERLTAFYSSWREYKEEQWGKADVLVISTESVGLRETLSPPISSSFLVWLLDDEFPETTAVFTNSGIEFLCTKESFSKLRTVGIRMTMVAKVTVSVQLKKRGEQCADWLKKTLCQVNIATKSGANRCPLVVGCIFGESMVMEALSHSKMFEVVYVHNSLTNPLGLLPKQFQMLSLGTLDGAKTANAVLFSEFAKMKSMDNKSYLTNTSEEDKSLLEKKGDTSSSLLTDSRVDNGGPVEQTKPEENKVFEEDNSSRKLADKMMLLEIKDMETSITEDVSEEKLLAEEQNMPSNPENSPLLQVKECGEPAGVTDAASESSLPDDNNGSTRKDSVGSDREDDDWTLVEMEYDGQETEVLEKFSWKRWLMDKTGKSLGPKDEVSDEAPSKRTKAD